MVGEGTDKSAIFFSLTVVLEEAALLGNSLSVVVDEEDDVDDDDDDDDDDEDGETTLELDPVEAIAFGCCWEFLGNNGLDLIGNSVLSGIIISSEEDGSLERKTQSA